MRTKDNQANIIPRNANAADVILAVVNGFFNLFKLEKMGAIVVIYLVIRDAIFVTKLSGNSDVSQWLIDTDVINKILENDNRLIFILGCIIALLVIVIFIILIWVIPIYKREIERLVGIRSRLMHEPNEHGEIKIRKHSTSKRR